MTRRNLVLGLSLLVSLAWSAWLLVADDGADTGVVQAVARHDAAPVAPAASSRDAAREVDRGIAAARREAGPVAMASLAPAPDGADPRGAGRVLDERPAAPAHPRNLFAEYSYEAPRPKVVVVPEKPHAPPLPFTYSGRLVIGATTTYLLMRGDTPVNLTVGADAGDFTLVEADPQRLVFVHEPTGERVALSLAKNP